MTSTVKCPNGHENSDSARFCRQCGAPVAQLPPVTAPTIGTEPSRDVTQAVPTVGPQPSTQQFVPSADTRELTTPFAGNQQGPTAPRRPWLPILLVTILAVAVVALGAVLAVAELSGGSKSSATTHNSTNPPATSALPDSQTATTAPTSATSSAGTVEAQAVSSLLQNSAQDRSEIVAAVAQITSCGDLESAQSTLDQAGSSRQSLIDQLGQLDTGALPNGAELVQTLRAAWQASVDSDNSYAAYAGDEMSNFGGCVPNDPNDSNAQAAANSDSQATSAKSEFVGLWNPIANTYGLQQWQASNL